MVCNFFRAYFLKKAWALTSPPIAHSHPTHTHTTHIAPHHTQEVLPLGGCYSMFELTEKRPSYWGPMETVSFQSLREREQLASTLSQP